MELMNEFYKKSNIYAHPVRQYRLPDGRLVPQGDQARCRLQRPEIPHRRICRASCCRSLACVPQPVAGSDIYSALEKGTIDAADWVGPYDDEKLGFRRWRSTIIYPAWWEGGAMLHNFINLDKWNSLPPGYKSVLRTASEMANGWMQAKYDASNPAALQRLITAGAKLVPFSDAGDGRLPRRGARPLSRGLRLQSRVQEGL